MKEIHLQDSENPNTVRIYDYLLGGPHNFEIDRQVGRELVSYLPFLTKAVRLQQWCYQDIAVDLERRGYDLLINITSALPTPDNLHRFVSPSTQVIYFARDPMVVEYGRAALADSPNTHFFQGCPYIVEEMFNQPGFLDLLQGRREVAFVFWSSAAFYSDETLAHAARFLYDWSSPNSCLVFHAQGAGANPGHPSMQLLLKKMDQLQSPLYLRSWETYARLLAPWTPDETGVISLLDWHGLDTSEMTPDDLEAWGAYGIGCAAYMVKSTPPGEPSS